MLQVPPRGLPAETAITLTISSQPSADPGNRNPRLGRHEDESLRQTGGGTGEYAFVHVWVQHIDPSPVNGIAGHLAESRPETWQGTGGAHRLGGMAAQSTKALATVCVAAPWENDPPHCLRAAETIPAGRMGGAAECTQLIHVCLCVGICCDLTIRTGRTDLFVG
jgi:hypothetical protein